MVSLLVLVLGICTDCGGHSGSPGVAPPSRAAANTDAERGPLLDPGCFRRTVETLSSDAMEGRGAGTQGLELAAEFLDERFGRIGLAPAVHDDGFRQSFDAVVGVDLGPDNSLRWNRDVLEVASALRLDRDFTPLGFSSSGVFAGDLVFAGYGIRAEPLGYDDYADIDARNKVVLAWRYEPGERDADSPFAGRRASRWSDPRYKAHVAREAGAVALILMEPPGDEHDRLPALRRHGPESPAGIPVLQVTRAVGDRWLKRGNASAERIQAKIDESYQPESFEVASVRIEGRADTLPRTARVSNVVGVWPGRGALADEAVVVGAHYDHLGHGGPGSMRPESDEIHNGADDNASGVAAMLCGVQALIEAQTGANADANGDVDGDVNVGRRTLVVVAFAAEEIGLGGSSWYVRHASFPLDRTVAMVNLDMVGRMQEELVYALGADTAPEWKPLLERVAGATGSGLAIEAGGDGYAASDQILFYERGIPVLQLFTGLHDEYHTPDDDVALLNFSGGARVAALLRGVLEELLTASDSPTYVASAQGSPVRGDQRGYGAYLGTIPDFTNLMSNEEGVRLQGLAAGGPAERAGLTRGDRIVEMAGIPVHNLYDMTYVLRDHRPGDIIDVVVERDGQRLTFGATLGQRGEAPSANRPSPHGAGASKPTLE